MMQCAHWTPDATEAHIVVEFLRANGIAASAFDTGFVRLNWLQTLALGGCRVMVSDSDTVEARDLVGSYLGGALGSSDPEFEVFRCCGCGGIAIEDLRPRRTIFLILIVSDWLLCGILLLTHSANGVSFVAMFYLAFLSVLLFPGVAAYAIKWRYRCTACGKSWRDAPRNSFCEMASAVENADRQQIHHATP